MECGGEPQSYIGHRISPIFRVGRSVPYEKEPSAFLRQKINILAKGDALVLAMGEGSNAVYLAQCGYTTTGIDISEFAIRKCIKLAKEKGIYINGMITDLDEDEMEKGSMISLLVFIFLIGHCYLK